MRLALLADPAVRSAFSRAIAREVEYHPSIDSTQMRARDLASAGASGVVVAEEQRAGQGTHGRVWYATAGSSLLASWIMRPAPSAPALFAALAGVAVARALDALGCEGARLEWPNDVLLAGRKVAGALAHATSDGFGGALVLGIGVNVRQRAEDFPVDVRERATSVAIAGRTVDRLALLARLSAELDRLTPSAARGAALDEWRARSTQLGRSVVVRLAQRDPIRGTATAIDYDGALLVETDSGRERILAGEVALA